MPWLYRPHLFPGLPCACFFAPKASNTYLLACPYQPRRKLTRVISLGFDVSVSVHAFLSDPLKAYLLFRRQKLCCRTDDDDIIPLGWGRGGVMTRLCDDNAVAQPQPPLPLPFSLSLPCADKMTERHVNEKSDRNCALCVFFRSTQRRIRSGLIHIRATATWKDRTGYNRTSEKIGLTRSALKEKNNTGRRWQSKGRGLVGLKEFGIPLCYCARTLAGHIQLTRGDSFQPSANPGCLMSVMIPSVVVIPLPFSGPWVYFTIP
jgi:hypothetical protein